MFMAVVPPPAPNFVRSDFPHRATPLPIRLSAEELGFRPRRPGGDTSINLPHKGGGGVWLVFNDAPFSAALFTSPLVWGRSSEPKVLAGGGWYSRSAANTSEFITADHTKVKADAEAWNVLQLPPPLENTRLTVPGSGRFPTRACLPTLRLWSSDRTSECAGRYRGRAGDPLSVSTLLSPSSLPRAR